MSISRSLCVIAGLACTAAFTASMASAQEHRVDWLVDVSYNAASRMGARADCDEVYDRAPSAGGSAACSVDDRMPAWSGGGGVMFLQRIGFRVGYLDYGKVGFHRTANVSTTITPQPGEPGPARTWNSTYGEDAKFGRARGLTLVALVRAPIGRIVPFGELGIWRWTAHSTHRSQQALSLNSVPLDWASYDFQRNDSSWDPLFGGGAEVWLSGMVALHGGVRLVRLSTPYEEIDELFTTFFFGAKIGRR